MTYIISEPCIDIKDKSCVDVCPVDCIHEMDRMLVIDPDECIDCGACEPECPVEAIFPEDALPDKWAPFVKINYAYPEGPSVINPLVERVRDRPRRAEHPARRAVTAVYNKSADGGRTTRMVVHAPSRPVSSCPLRSATRSARPSTTVWRLSGRTVVGNRQLGPAGGRLAEADPHRARWAAPHHLIDRVPRHLVEPGARTLSEAGSLVEVELARGPTGDERPLDELSHCGREPVLVERARLEALDDLPQLCGRLTRHLERTDSDRPGSLQVTVLERADACFDHLRQRREILDGTVVHELRDSASLVALGEQPFAEWVAQSIIASRSAIATACVLVSASSLARMWRTWLLTVSCEMKSRVATSMFDMPSASS